MPQSPTNIFRWCLLLILPTDISVSIVQRVLKYLLPMPQSSTASSSVIYHWKYKQNKFAGKVLAGNFFWHASLVYKTISVWFFLFLIELATKRGITDDQYSDGRIPLVVPSIKMLPMNCVSYTDRMHPLVKLFNSIV